MGKQYASVEEVVSDLADEDFADAFAERSEETKLGRALFVLRNSSGMTQRELGERIGWTQSLVSYFERKATKHYRLGELKAYLDALGLDLHVTLSVSAKETLPQGGEQGGEVDFIVQLNKEFDVMGEDTEYIVRLTREIGFLDCAQRDLEAHPPAGWTARMVALVQQAIGKELRTKREAWQVAKGTNCP